MKKIKRSFSEFIIPVVIIILTLLFILFFVAYATSDGKGLIYQSYQVGNLTIQLPKSYDWQQYDDQDADLALISDDMMCLVIQDSKSTFSDNGVDVPNLFSYSCVIAYNNDIDTSSVVQKEQYCYFDTIIEVSDENYFYKIFIYEDEENFYIINFACFESDKDKLESYMVQWADNVTINQ